MVFCAAPPQRRAAMGWMRRPDAFWFLCRPGLYAPPSWGEMESVLQVDGGMAGVPAGFAGVNWKLGRRMPGDGMTLSERRVQTPGIGSSSCRQALSRRAITLHPAKSGPWQYYKRNGKVPCLCFISARDVDDNDM